VTADRVTCEHEAAHAVAALMLGLEIHRVCVYPDPDSRARRVAGMLVLGYCDVLYPPHLGWPVETNPQADILQRAAGLAWEVYVLGLGDESWLTGQSIDRWCYASEDFAEAGKTISELFAHPEVASAVREVADTLQQRRSGVIYGRTVARILHRRGLLVTADPWAAAQGPTTDTQEGDAA
jgi:hypothetical protein